VVVAAVDDVVVVTVAATATAATNAAAAKAAATKAAAVTPELSPGEGQLFQRRGYRLNGDPLVCRGDHRKSEGLSCAAGLDVSQLALYFWMVHVAWYLLLLLLLLLLQLLPGIVAGGAHPAVSTGGRHPPRHSY
jgi:hypothetical protein